jgi:nucleoside-diphosphate-sugar epimerase
MKTLVIGASGYVGGRVVRAFKAAGHEVSGLARSNSAAARVADAGATVIAGDLNDLDALRPHVEAADCVILTMIVDFATERRAVEMLVDTLAGTNKPLVMTSGTAVLAKRTEGYWFDGNYAEDEPWEGDEINRTRMAIEKIVRDGAQRGIRATVVRPPMIWGHGHAPPVHALHSSARTGAICYVGPGLNVFSTIHVDDLADIFLRAATTGTPGALYHAVSGETNFRSLAEQIASLRGLKTRSISGAEIEEVFGPFLGPVVFASCNRTRCPRTRADLGWEPHPDRLDLYAELAHPAFMGIDVSPDAEVHFTLADALKEGRKRD